MLRSLAGLVIVGVLCVPAVGALAQGRPAAGVQLAPVKTGAELAQAYTAERARLETLESQLAAAEKDLTALSKQIAERKAQGHGSGILPDYTLNGLLQRHQTQTAEVSRLRERTRRQLIVAWRAAESYRVALEQGLVDVGGNVKAADKRRAGVERFIAARGAAVRAQLERNPAAGRGRAFDAAALAERVDFLKDREERKLKQLQRVQARLGEINKQRRLARRHSEFQRDLDIFNPWAGGRRGADRDDAGKAENTDNAAAANTTGAANPTAGTNGEPTAVAAGGAPDRTTTSAAVRALAPAMTAHNDASTAPAADTVAGDHVAAGEPAVNTPVASEPVQGRILGAPDVQSAPVSSIDPSEMDDVAALKRMEHKLRAEVEALRSRWRRLEDRAGQARDAERR